RKIYKASEKIPSAAAAAFTIDEKIYIFRKPLYLQKSENENMNELLIKYNALSPEIQREVDDFLDFLLSKYKDKKNFDMKSWKEKIKGVSVWSEEDVKVFEENSKLF